MPDLEEIRENIDNYESPALQIDGHDNAIIGAGFLGGDDNYILVYSEQKILANLVEQGMNNEEAREFYEFNIMNAYMGEGTPVIIDERED